MTVIEHNNVSHIDADGQAHTGPGKLERVILYTSNTAGGAVQCFDGTDNTGYKLTPVLAVDPKNAAQELLGTEVFEIGAEFDTGVYCDFTLTAHEAVLVFAK